MKKIIKPILVSLLSLLLLILAAVSFLVWFAFTPARLGPLVQKQTNDILSCKALIGDVELTFFSTFPQFGVKVNDVLLINPTVGSISDTLASIDHLLAKVDVAALWKNNELIISSVFIYNGNFNLYIDSVGTANFDVLTKDTISSAKAGSSMDFTFIDIYEVKLENINFALQHDSLKIKSNIYNLDALISGTIHDDLLKGRMQLNTCRLFMEYKGVNYLDNVSLAFDLPIEYSSQRVYLNEAFVSVNGLKLQLDGEIGNNTHTQILTTDVRFDFHRWPVKVLSELVPPPLYSYLTGIEADGIISSRGTIIGSYNSTSLPLMDIHLKVENGKLKHTSFPLPLHDLMADINVYTDFSSDDISYVKVNQFMAKTPLSAFAVSGSVQRLYSDLHCRLLSDVSISMQEMEVFAPDTFNSALKGHISGYIHSDFRLSHLEQMQWERMNHSGSILATRLDVKMDSIWLKTNRARIKFKLPNRATTNKSSDFAYTDIDLDKLEAGMVGKYNILMRNALILLETSDIRDKTRMPDLICSFTMDSLAAHMDTLHLSLSKPTAEVLVAPVAERIMQPQIQLNYTGRGLSAEIGTDTISISRLAFDTGVVNDQDQDDIFLRWMAKGFLDLEQAKISTARLSYPVEIPMIKMNFEPEYLNVEGSRIVIDNSDFELSGNLYNILSYFRGDSLLRGTINFQSSTTDILQLMSLTNGIGNDKESTLADTPEYAGIDSTSAQPYMVPQGIDMILNTNITQASFGIDTATNIKGTLGIRDGVMLLDDFSFVTSAARMQLTAMYKTPRRNHLFLGLNYHMLDIEIEELLKIIPDIDTLMPMLRSFKGKGEFHLAIQSNLDSNYNIKKSTLLGSSSIKGENLVLMDGETFSEIAKTLRFNKKTENRVDTLSAEFTIFREEIDVYPFLLVMDKYKAVVAGKHNFDLSFDYHISVVDSPLPIKFGVNIHGNLDALSYKPAKPKYAEMYRPFRRGVVQNQQFELRRMIRESLMQRIDP